jgi:glycosyltransferase involved in cell wall biosynthesis
VTDDWFVGVVVPTYERAFCVGDAVRSVLDQTHENVECIVVDDGSTDDTVELLHAMFGDDARVRLVEQAHAGVSAARNRGIDLVSGEYVTFLDSDDLMKPNRIEHQLACLADSAVDAVMGRHEIMLAGTSEAFPRWLEQRPDWWENYYHTSILLPVAHARAVGGYDENLRTGEDVDFAVRVRTAGLRIGMLDEVVVTRRYFGDNLTYDLPDDDQPLMDAARRSLARRRARVDP